MASCNNPSPEETIQLSRLKPELALLQGYRFSHNKHKNIIASTDHHAELRSPEIEQPECPQKGLITHGADAARFMHLLV